MVKLAMQVKRCFKCGEIKPLDEFHQHRQMADGHLNKCKVCASKDASREKGIYKRQCIVCGKEFNINASELRKHGGKYCSLKCYWKVMKGKKPKNWEWLIYSPEGRLKRSQSAKRRWRNPDYVRRVMAKHQPNKPEQQLIALIEAHHLPFKYVGNGEFILGGKCPDFLNTDGKKQLIELFGTYWHPVFDVAKRTEHFRSYGFSTLCIWEDELQDEAKTLKKIKQFARRLK